MALYLTQPKYRHKVSAGDESRPAALARRVNVPRGCAGTWKSPRGQGLLAEGTGDTGNNSRDQGKI